MTTAHPAPAVELATDWLRPLGRTGLTVSAVCAGGGPLGSMPENFGYDVSAERGIRTAARVLDGPITFLDTSNGYSGGESERRIGAAIRDRGSVPDGFLLATKVDRDGAGDFSGERVRRSLDESLERLGLDSVDLLYLHDPEHITFEEGMAAAGPVEALLDLQRQGLARHLGVAGGPVALMDAYIGTGAFEVVLTHNRWTLVDRSADALLDRAASLGVAAVNAAVFGGGILAVGSTRTSKYAYRQAPAEVLTRIGGIEQVCARYGVSLAAAALQFSLRDPRIASTVVGFSHPQRVDEIVGQASAPLPAEIWPELAGLAAPGEFWLDPPAPNQKELT